MISQSFHCKITTKNESGKQTHKIKRRFLRFIIVKKQVQGKDSYTHILKYTSLFGGVQGLTILIGLVRNKLVAVLLGPYGMGLSSLFATALRFMSDITNLGVPISAVKNTSEAFDQGDEAAIHRNVGMVRLWSILSALFGTLLCVVLSPLLSWLTFSWEGHTLHFIILAPAVGFTILTGGELAILKGTRRLRALAKTSVYGVFGSLLCTVPLFYFYREQAIIPSLVLLALLQMTLTLGFSLRHYPLRICFSRQLLRGGYSMIRLGLAFMVAGIMGSGADFFIRSYLNNVAQADNVGLFNAAYMMTMTYAGMVFSAMETDYYPRLSGVNQLGITFNTMVNRQIEVSLLLVSPLLVVFLIGQPIFLPLLFSSKFMPALGIMQIMSLAIYLRAMKLPVQYIPLAKGDSRGYLFIEGAYDVLVIIAVIFFYQHYGLIGTGIAIGVMAVVDFLITYVYCRWRYGFKPSASVLRYAALQLPLGAMAYGLTFVDNPLIYWGGSALLAFISFCVSITILKRKTHLWNRLTQKINRKLHRK